MPRMSRPPRRPTAIVGLTALAFSSATACGDDPEPDQVAYCVDESNTVVDDDYCDDDYDGRGGGGFFFLAYGVGFPRGAPVGTRLSGGSRISARDTAARAAAGLPSTGRVVNGSTGGFGTRAGTTGGAGGGGFGSRGTSGGG